MYYYRTSNGTEVDLLLSLPGSKLWAIEVKRSSAAKIERGFYSACADLSPRKRFLVSSGTERFPLNHDTDAIGVAELAAVLESADEGQTPIAAGGLSNVLWSYQVVSILKSQ